MNIILMGYKFYLEPLYLLIGFLAFATLMLIIAIILFVKVGKMKKKYKVFMGDENSKSLEKLILEKLDEIESLKTETKNNRDDIKKIEEELLQTLNKVGIVKYDAFNEMGGKLSFALALLNEKNDGFIINAMHSREGCYTYIKEIIKGESFIALGEEERMALSEAINGISGNIE